MEFRDWALLAIGLVSGGLILSSLGKKTKTLHSSPQYSSSATLSTAGHTKIYISDLPTNHRVDYSFYIPPDFHKVDKFVVNMYENKTETFNMKFQTGVRKSGVGLTHLTADNEPVSFVSNWADIDLTSLGTDITASFTADSWVGLSVGCIADQGSGRIYYGDARLSYY